MINLSNKKRIFIITLVLYIISFLTTILLYVTVNKDKINYEKIECIVTNVTKERNYGKKNRGNRYDYTVTVSYNNKSYKLINVYDSNIYNYYKGAVVDAYLSNDKLYANEAGVRASSSKSTLYFVFLFVTIGMFVVCLTAGTNYKKVKSINN